MKMQLHTKRNTIETCEERLAELKDLLTDLELQTDAVQSEIEDLEYDIEQENERLYDERAFEETDREWEEGLNAFLTDIGTMWRLPR